MTTTSESYVPLYIKQLLSEAFFSTKIFIKNKKVFGDGILKWDTLRARVRYSILVKQRSPYKSNLSK